MLLACAPLCARNIEIANNGVSETRVARLQTQVEGAFEHVALRTGLDDDGDIYLVPVSGSRRFAEIAANDGVAMDAESVMGYAVPSKRRVVLNFSAMDERGIEPLGVLRHEIAHLVMGRMLKAQRPLWFEEGLANYVENMALNALIEGGHVSLASVDYTGLDDLSAGLRDARVGDAYPQSRKVVQVIVSAWGEKALHALIDDLRDGRTQFPAAFKKATGAELPELESRWQKQREEESRGSFVAWLGLNWGWLLFAAGGVLLVFGVYIRKQRGKRQVETWEEQEKLFPSDPAWSYKQPDEGYAAGDDDESAPTR